MATQVLESDILVIGAGPAGLTAAIECARLGCKVLIADENGLPGGQYLKQIAVPRSQISSYPAGTQVERGRKLIDEARALGVEIWPSTSVWGAYPGPFILLDHGSGGVSIRPKRLIVCSGAHDRTHAFPGWTLPGVMTPGAAQTLIKAQGILPGSDIIVAGSGPFLLVVANEILKAGGKVAAFVELQRWAWSSFLRFLAYPERYRELGRYVLRLLRHRVPLYIGYVVTGASGGDTLQSVSIARAGRHALSSPSEARTITADALAIAYGFRPSTEITALLGCEHGFEDRRGGRYCRVGPETGETSVPGIYAAGEVTGIAGAEAAFEEGRIAGLSAARSLGRWSLEGDDRLASSIRRHKRYQRFANLVNQTFAPDLDLPAMLTPETVICRCEEVTAASVRDAVADGASTVQAVKMWTRAGMGPCQGRICGWTVNSQIASLTGKQKEAVGVNEPRLPIKPVPLGSILASIPDSAPRYRQDADDDGRCHG